MSEFDAALLERSRCLRNVMLKLESKYADLPKGVFYRIKKKGKVYYYYIDEDNAPKLRYIRRENNDLLRGLAQRKYVEDLREACEAEVGAIDSYLAKLPAVRAEELYDRTEEDVREIIDPVVDNDARFALRWERDNYTPRLKVSLPDGLETDHGEWVKSKSECLIANMLYKNKIPYV